MEEVNVYGRRETSWKHREQKAKSLWSGAISSSPWLTILPPLVSGLSTCHLVIFYISFHHRGVYHLLS